MALDFLAGCVGGAAGVLVGHPLDTVKVRLQMQSPDNIKYKGTLHCLSTIVKQESVRGLYKGISSPLFGVAGVNAIIFGVYGALQPHVKGSPGNDSLWAHFAAGSISGAVQSFIASPMELVKIRQQLNESSPGSKLASAWDVLKGIYRQQGSRGIMKGWGITVAREMPGFGTYFATYEALTTKTGRQVGTFGMMMAGGMAGVASWIVTFPIDVVKTRLQSDVSGKYSGVMDCIKKTYAREGYSAFSRGLVSTVIRAFPTNAATFTVVTWIMRWADQKQEYVEDGRQYLQELMFETSQLKESIDESIQLQLPHYSMPLATQWSKQIRNGSNFAQNYLNFYELIKQNPILNNMAANSERNPGIIRDRMQEAFKNDQSCNSKSSTPSSMNELTFNLNLNSSRTINNVSNNNNSSSTKLEMNCQQSNNQESIDELRIKHFRKNEELSHGTGTHPAPQGCSRTMASVHQANQDLTTLSQVLDTPTHILQTAKPSVASVEHANLNQVHSAEGIPEKNVKSHKACGSLGCTKSSTSPSSRSLTLGSFAEALLEHSSSLAQIGLCQCFNDHCVCLS